LPATGMDLTDKDSQPASKQSNVNYLTAVHSTTCCWTKGSLLCPVRIQNFRRVKI